MDSVQNACDDLEVSVASLEIIFSMLRVILSMDVNTVVDIGHNINVKNINPPPSISLSKQDFEGIEVARSSLWKLSWKAIHHVDTINISSNN